MLSLLKSMLTRMLNSWVTPECICYSPRFEDCKECGFPKGCYFSSDGKRRVGLRM